MTDQWQRLARVAALLDLNRPEEAVLMAQEAVSADPENVNALCYLAMALTETDPSAGVKASEAALRGAPHDPWAQRLRGWALHQAGFEALALEQLKAAVAADPLNASARIMFASVVISSDLPRRLQGHRLAQAQTYVDEAMRINPNDPDAYFAQAALDLINKDPLLAESSARQGLQIAPAEPIGHQLLGIVAQERGHTGTAGDHFVSAAKLSPRSSTSTELLRSLRKARPLGKVAFLVLFIIAARIAKLGALWGQAVLLLLGASLVVGLVVYQVVLPRLQTRRELSEEARTAVDRAKQLRQRWPWQRR